MNFNKELEELEEEITDIYIEKKFGDITNTIVVEYSDNSGSTETIMEHGDIFDKVKYLRMNKH